MAIALLEAITSREAYFENNAISGQDDGHITWTAPVLSGTDKYDVDFQGLDVEGGTISTTTVTMDSEEPPSNSEIFWFIAETLKNVLCPECE